MQKDCIQDATLANISMAWVQDWDLEANSESGDGDRDRDIFEVQGLQTGLIVGGVSDPIH